MTNLEKGGETQNGPACPACPFCKKDLVRSELRELVDELKGMGVDIAPPEEDRVVLAGRRCGQAVRTRAMSTPMPFEGRAGGYP